MTQHNLDWLIYAIVIVLFILLIALMVSPSLFVLWT